MAETLKPDLCVIGAGSAGLSVAAIAAAFGVSCVLIEKGAMGGDCLNTGCVPSKALLAAGKHAEAIRRAPAFGITAGDPQPNFGRINRHVHKVIDAIAPNDSVARFRAMGVNVIEGEARFADRSTVTVGETTIKARRFVVATGSTPLVPPIPGLDQVPYLTNETLFDLTNKPAHLIIIGGGPIGMEMAQAHRRLGCEVTVLEAARAFGKDDPEVAAIVVDRLRAEGVDIREGARVSAVAKAGGGVKVTVETEAGNEDVTGTHLLLAVGRSPTVNGLGLEAAGIAFDAKGVTVDKGLRTKNRKVYAIGDVAGGPQFTHVANYHAGLVIQSALFRIPVEVNNDVIPWVTYTDPELAHVGLTETAARERGHAVRILRWPFSENDRAQAERETTGFAKIVTDKKGRILGATIAGPHAGEVIQMWTLAVTQKLKIGAMRDFISPYPTFSEVSKRAAVTFYGDMPRKPMVRRLLAFLRSFG